MAETKDEIIDIDRNEDVVIEVSNVVEVPVVTEEAEVQSILTKWKRVLIGTSLLMMIILPIVGGAVLSYLLRKELFKPTDPYNIWPSSEYRGPTAAEGWTPTYDVGYSTQRNNYVRIRSDTEDYFVVINKSYGSIDKMYMAVYMVENLFGDEKNYCLHVVSSEDKDNLDPYKDITSANNMIEIFEIMDGMFRNYSGYGINSVESCYIKGDLANPLITRLNAQHFVGFKTSHPNEVMNEFFGKLKTIIDADPAAFYNSTDQTASYAFGPYGINEGSLNNEILNALRDSRNEMRLAAECLGTSKVNDTEVIKDKPKFKKIQMKTLEDLSS